MVSQYIPHKGDIVYLNFTPQAGKEQSGKRPALCISAFEYNTKVGLALFCPITSKIKDYPFEVILPQSLKTHGAILSDHIKSLDFHSRDLTYIETLPEEQLEEVLQKIFVLIE